MLSAILIQDSLNKYVEKKYSYIELKKALFICIHYLLYCLDSGCVLDMYMYVIVGQRINF